ncbi:MAG: hypothetical protein ABSA44_10600 [Bacteroidota bacterium]|jgi:hypothetical protein
MIIEREKIRTGLIKKGFKEGGTKHDLYTLVIDGKIYPIGTKLSRGTGYKDYTDRLVTAVCHQLGLTTKEINPFLECTIKLSKYAELLKQRGKIRETN